MLSRRSLATLRQNDGDLLATFRKLEQQQGLPGAGDGFESGCRTEMGSAGTPAVEDKGGWDEAVDHKIGAQRAAADGGGRFGGVDL